MAILILKNKKSRMGSRKFSQSAAKKEHFTKQHLFPTQTSQQAKN